MKACNKTPKFNVLDLVYVGDYRSKVFEIITVMYEKSTNSFVYSIDNLHNEGCGHNCNKAFYREDELTEAIPEFAIGDTLRNLEITNVKYNDKIHEFEYKVWGEFHTFAEVKELTKSVKPRAGLVVKSDGFKGIILTVNDELQVYCVLWENGYLSPYIPFDANYIAFTSVVYETCNNAIYSSFFEGVYNDFTNKKRID